MAMDVIQTNFDHFHEENPWVYTRLKDMALQMLNSGTVHYGMKAMFEVLRYEHAQTKSADTLKLNNNYTALYARMLEQAVPELRGFFQKRERKARFIAGQIVRPADRARQTVDCYDRPTGNSSQRMLFDTSKPAERC